MNGPTTAASAIDFSYLIFQFIKIGWIEKSNLLFPDHLGSVENSGGSHGRRAHDGGQTDAEEPGRDSEAAEENIQNWEQASASVERGLRGS